MGKYKSMADFTIYRHEIVRFVNDVIQKDKTCNCSLVFNISDEDALKINELLYCIVEGAFTGDNTTKDCELLRQKIKDIAECCKKRQK